MGVGGKFQAAVLLRDDHAEEALVLDVLPRLRAAGHGAAAGGFPVVGQAAQLLALVVEKGLLLGGQVGTG
jgi:hypothetical protein